jgi:hypothetical protein
MTLHDIAWYLQDLRIAQAYPEELKTKHLRVGGRVVRNCRTPRPSLAKLLPALTCPVPFRLHRARVLGGGGVLRLLVLCGPRPGERDGSCRSVSLSAWGSRSHEHDEQSRGHDPAIACQPTDSLLHRVTPSRSHVVTDSAPKS